MQVAAKPYFNTLYQSLRFVDGLIPTFQTISVADGTANEDHVVGRYGALLSHLELAEYHTGVDAGEAKDKSRMFEG